MQKALFFLLIFSTFAFTPLSLEPWKVVEDYNIRFSGRGAEGSFRGLQGEIRFDPQDLAASRMDVRVATETISTGNNLKDKHARGEDWFDVERFPYIRFQSESFTSTESGFAVTGTLELHGISREQRIPFTFTPTEAGGLFQGSFSLSRSDFDIQGNWADFMVGDTFQVELRVPVKPGE
jgi:polyisoprenoid-binding protein YceI